jgi:nucleoside-diphosphate-sugar epimerase
LKIAILGSEGFVGRNLVEDLSSQFVVLSSSRRLEHLKGKKDCFFFDIDQVDSWQVLRDINPSCIINCIGYGVVRTQQDTVRMIEVNYLRTIEFYRYISLHLPAAYLIHIGSAFEYDLELENLSEFSVCLPKTHYGISKYLSSQYLLSVDSPVEFTIIRPFNMFGPYEHQSKLLPSLILAQRNKEPISLSEGNQKRDYFFVKDLSALLSTLISNKSKRISQIINVGRGKPLSIKQLAEPLRELLPSFHPSFWLWDSLPDRKGESLSFFNNSLVARETGMEFTDLNKALKLTINYYWNV